MLTMKKLVSEAHKISKLREKQQLSIKEGKINPKFDAIANELWAYKLKLMRQLSTSSMSSATQSRIESHLNKILDEIQYYQEG